MAYSFYSKLLPLGRIFVAVATIAYGVQFFIYAHSIAALSQTWPDWLRGAPYTEYLAGAALIVTGLAIIIRVRTQLATVLLGTAILLWVACLTLPPAIVSPKDPRPRNNVAEASAVCAGLFFVAQSIARQKKSATQDQTPLDFASEKLGTFGRFFYAVGLIIFGSEHITYAEYVATLVPAWIPGHLFWAEFCGTALLAAAVGIVFNIVGSLSAALVGLMILLFGAFVNGPRAFGAWNNGDEWTSLFHTLMWSGAAFILSGLLVRSAKPTQSGSKSPSL